MLVTVDWETQSEEMILVSYQIGEDFRDSTGFIVGRPMHDNADDERRVLEKAVAAARAVVGEHDQPLFRLIVDEQFRNVRAIWGSPQQPVHVDAAFESGDELPTAVIAAAHALVEAKLDPHEDTAA